MRPNRVPDDLIQASFKAIRAWHTANPGSNSYLDDRTQMRIVLAAALTLHSQQVEQPLRERVEAAERELAEARARLEAIGETREEWGVENVAADRVTSVRSRAGAQELATSYARVFPKQPHRAVTRLVGEWHDIEQEAAR